MYILKWPRIKTGVLLGCQWAMRSEKKKLKEMRRWNLGVDKQQEQVVGDIISWGVKQGEWS